MAWAEKVPAGAVSSAPPNGEGSDQGDALSTFAIVRPGLFGIGYRTASDAAHAEDMRRIKSRFLMFK